VAFKASTSSKSKGKVKKEASSEDEDASDIDDEAITLLVCKIGKFMKKRGYGARKRRDHMKEHVRLCFECKSLDHIAANCPYRSDNEEDKKKKKDKKVAMWSLGIVIAPMIVMMMMVQVMMTRGPSRRHLKASPSTTSHPSSTLLRYALWQSPLR
jgi:hypothetical protein